MGAARRSPRRRFDVCPVRLQKRTQVRLPLSAIEKLLIASRLLLGSTCAAGFAAHSMNDQNGGGGGCFGFGPNARAVSRCGRLTLDRASCRAFFGSPICLYCGLISAARNATTSSISASVSASGCMSLSSQGTLLGGA